MTVGNADTLWRPYFFSAVTFESRVTAYGRVIFELWRAS